MPFYATIAPGLLQRPWHESPPAQLLTWLQTPDPVLVRKASNLVMRLEFTPILWLHVDLSQWPKCDAQICARGLNMYKVHPNGLLYLCAF